MDWIRNHIAREREIKAEKEDRICRGCHISIKHKHPNAKFHNKRCKDKFHNRNNPRGKFAHLKDREEVIDEGPDEWG